MKIYGIHTTNAEFRIRAKGDFFLVRYTDLNKEGEKGARKYSVCVTQYDADNMSKGSEIYISKGFCSEYNARLYVRIFLDQSKTK